MLLQPVSHSSQKQKSPRREGFPLSEDTLVSMDSKNNEGRLKTSVQADNESVSSGIESTTEY